MANISALAGLPGNVTPDKQGADTLASEGLDMVNASSEEFKKRVDRPPVMKVETKFEKDGTPVHSFSGVSDETLQRLTENAKIGELSQQIPDPAKANMAAYLNFGEEYQRAADDLVNRFKSKREALEANPILAGVGRIASSAAIGYAGGRGDRLGPLIRGMGAYGADAFGETPDELAAKETAVRAQQLGIQGDVSRHLESRQERLADRSARDRTLSIQEDNLRRNTQDDVMRIFEQSAQSGKAPDLEAMKSTLRESGVFNEKEISARVSSLKSLANAANFQFEQRKKFEFSLERLRAGHRRSEIASARAAEMTNRQAEANIARIEQIGSKREALLRAESAALTQFAVMAGSLGMNPPTTRKAATAILSKALVDPKNFDQKAALLSDGPKMIAALEPNMKSLDVAEKAFNSRLPAELREIYATPITEEEVLAPEAGPFGPTRGKRYKEIVISEIEAGRTTEARGREMFEQIDSGKVPPEFKEIFKSQGTVAQVQPKSKSLLEKVQEKRDKASDERAKKKAERRAKLGLE